MNALQTAHTALAALLASLFPDAEPVRNPNGHQPPRLKGGNALAAYVAMDDDEDPETLAIMTGPVFDLKIAPRVTIAFVGLDRQARLTAAWTAVDTLKNALAADRSLGGAVQYAELQPASQTAGGVNDWLAGGLEIPVTLLVTATSAAG